MVGFCYLKSSSVSLVGSTSGKPARDVQIDKIAARADVEHTSFQSTAPIVAVVPTVATNVCAAVFNALLAAAFAHFNQYCLFSIFSLPYLSVLTLHRVHRLCGFHQAIYKPCVSRRLRGILQL